MANANTNTWSVFDIEMLDVYIRHRVPIDNLVKTLGRTKGEILERIAKNTIENTLKDNQMRDHLRGFLFKVSFSSEYLNPESIHNALSNMTFLDALKYSGAVDDQNVSEMEKGNLSPLQVRTTETEPTAPPKQTLQSTVFQQSDEKKEECNVPQVIKDTCIRRYDTGKFCTNKRLEAHDAVGSYLCAECLNTYPDSYHIRNKHLDCFPALVFYNLTKEAAEEVRRNIPYSDDEVKKTAQLRSGEGFKFSKYVSLNDQLILVVVFQFEHDAQNFYYNYLDRVMYGKKVVVVPYNVDILDSLYIKDKPTDKPTDKSINELEIQSYLKEQLTEAVKEIKAYTNNITYDGYTPIETQIQTYLKHKLRDAVKDFFM